jgi:hypothetical protein
MHAECADAMSLFFIINKLYIVILFIALQLTALHRISSPESDHQASLLIPVIVVIVVMFNYIGFIEHEIFGHLCSLQT